MMTPWRSRTRRSRRPPPIRHQCASAGLPGSSASSERRAGAEPAARARGVPEPATQAEPAEPSSPRPSPSRTRTPDPATEAEAPSPPSQPTNPPRTDPEPTVTDPNRPPPRPRSRQRSTALVRRITARTRAPRGWGAGARVRSGQPSIFPGGPPSSRSGLRSPCRRGWGRCPRRRRPATAPAAWRIDSVPTPEPQPISIPLESPAMICAIGCPALDGLPDVQARPPG